MKNVILIITIVFCGILMQSQAQNEFTGEQFISLQTFGSGSDSLYNGHNYNYYSQEYKSAKGMKIFGIVLTSLGTVAFITGFVYMNIDFNIGGPLLLSGFAVANLGGAIWIYHSVRCKNINNAMEQITRKTSLSFGTTDSGVGLILRF